MALDVIGAGLGRNATLSTKLALERIGFGPCYHMTEVFANIRRALPLWLDVVHGKPDWDAIFDGYRATTDHPACNYWRELSDQFPEGKVLLTVRDPDSWFESVSETIYSPRMQAGLVGTPMGEMMQGTLFDHFDGDMSDRAFMTDWYRKRNQEIVDTIAPGRLLVFHPKEGWEPLCEFLGVPVPDCPFPRVNSRDELGAANDQAGGLPADPAAIERWGRNYLDEMERKAFA